MRPRAVASLASLKDDELFKSLAEGIEAVARHALVETTGGYVTKGNFPATMYQAFERLGLSPSPPSVSDHLDSDPRAAVQQAVYLLALREPPSQRAGDGPRSPGSYRPRRERLEDRLPRDGARL